MYQMRYEDIVEESGINSRERESALFDRCIKMLEESRDAGVDSDVARRTAIFVNDLWLTLIEDLGSEDNSLPTDLKASLISIGIFMLKEVQKLRNAEEVDFDSLIFISKSIRDGLAAQLH